MASVYDILLELPILKGIGRERLSTLLEKTHLDFKTVKAQALMAKTGELCNTVRCVLSGSFEKITGCIGGELTVREEVTAPAIIGLENLFGLDTTYCSDYNAVTECSVMEFPKMQLVSLLSDNEICLINMLNYLSAASQRPFDAWRSRTSSGLAGNLQRLLATAVSSGRGVVFIESAQLMSICYCARMGTADNLINPSLYLWDLLIYQTLKNGKSIAVRGRLPNVLMQRIIAIYLLNNPLQ